MTKPNLYVACIELFHIKSNLLMEITDTGWTALITFFITSFSEYFMLVILKNE